MRRKRRLALGWCALALCGVLAIVMVGARILVRDTTGEDFLRAREAAFHTKGTWYDERLAIVFRTADNPGLRTDVQGYFIEDTLNLFFPAGTELSALKCRYATSSGAQLYYGEERVRERTTSLDLAEGAGYFTLDETRFDVWVYETSLPVLRIDTYEDAPVYSRDFFVTGEATLYAEDGALLQSMPVSTRVRGNTTSELPKLPYRFKSTVAASLLGLPEDDHWVLLANFLDPTSLRNTLAMDMARALEMEYVPDFRLVELYLRGQYMGVYALGTQVGLSSGSVDLPALHKTGDGEWTGSYLLEFDRRWDIDEEAGYYESALGIPLRVKEPDYYDEAMLDEILRDLTLFERCLLREDLSFEGVHYSEVIDLASFAKGFVLHEAVGNGEAAMPFSIYMYRDADGRLAMGPVWDFDLGFYNDTEGFILTGANWFAYLIQDEAFCNAVRQAWAMLDEYYMGFDARVDAYAEAAASAHRNNFIVTYIGVNDYSNTPADDPYREEIADLKAWMAARHAWLDAHMDDLEDLELWRYQQVEK